MDPKAQSVAGHQLIHLSVPVRLEQIVVWLNPVLARHLQYLRSSQNTRLSVEILGLQLYEGQRISVTTVHN